MLGDAPERGEEALDRRPEAAGLLQRNDHGLDLDAGALGTSLAALTALLATAFAAGFAVVITVTAMVAAFAALALGAIGTGRALATFSALGSGVLAGDTKLVLGATTVGLVTFGS